MTIRINAFVEDLISSTKKDPQIKWMRVPKAKLNYLLDQSIPRAEVKDAYYSFRTNSTDAVSIGRYEVPRYVDEDDYYVNDYYFVAFSNEKFEDVVTFYNDDDASADLQATVMRLFRLIKLTVNDVENKISNWFVGKQHQ